MLGVSWIRCGKSPHTLRGLWCPTIPNPCLLSGWPIARFCQRTAARTFLSGNFPPRPASRGRGWSNPGRIPEDGVPKTAIAGRLIPLPRPMGTPLPTPCPTFLPSCPRPGASEPPVRFGGQKGRPAASRTNREGNTTRPTPPSSRQRVGGVPDPSPPHHYPGPDRIGVEFSKNAFPKPPLRADFPPLPDASAPRRRRLARPSSPPAPGQAQENLR